MLGAIPVVTAESELGDVGRGSKTNVRLGWCAELLVVFCTPLLRDSCVDDESPPCGAAQTVSYVVDVTVTVEPNS